MSAPLPASQLPDLCPATPLVFYSVHLQHPLYLQHHQIRISKPATFTFVHYVSRRLLPRLPRDPFPSRRRYSTLPLISYHYLTNLIVWIKRGICSADALINLLLCLLGFIPGLLHAWYIIAQYPEDNGYAPIAGDGGEGAPGNGNGQVYYVVHSAPPSHGSQLQGNKNYGTAPARKPAQNAGKGAQSSQQQAGPSEGSSAPPPPTYEDAIKGDHKVQHS